MPNSTHLTEFAGLPVVEFPGYDTVDHEYRDMVRGGIPVPDPYPPHAALAAALADPGSVAWRLRMEVPVDSRLRGGFFQSRPLEDATAYVARFAEEVDLSAVSALLVGDFPDGDHRSRSDEVHDLLTGLAPEMPNLRSLFFGEITKQENEISWIQLCDLAPLVSALPGLTELIVRGGSGELGLGIREHRALRRLTVQSGALRPEVVRDVCASSLPELEHLELWLGVEEYGGETVPEDLAPVLSGAAFPRLRSLGLRNTEQTGVWVRALAEAPVTTTLHTLDLSLGTLRDEDVPALVGSPVFRNLGKLDLHHHYLSEESRKLLVTALPEVEIDLSRPKEPDPDDWYDEDDEDEGPYYYTAVSE